MSDEQLINLINKPNTLQWNADTIAIMSYDKIDRFLRNNLDDVAYEEYAKALDFLYSRKDQ